MKTIITSLLVLFSFSLLAQNTSTISITVLGTSFNALLLDGKSYTVQPTNTTLNEPILITGILPGKHNLQMVKKNNNTISKKITRTNYFTSRAGFNMTITVSKDESLQIKENKNVVAIPRKPAMSEANFNILLSDIKRQWIPGSKMTAASNAFTNPNNYFTISQAGKIIELVKDEGNRVLLAKTAYPNIVDQANFTQLYDLLENQPSKDALTAFVNNYNNKSNPTYNEKVAMLDASFTSLLQSADKQWLPGAKMTAANNAFSNANNYFTVNQARQLIALVNDESNRLQLAKLSYRSIVDTSNFNELYGMFSNQMNRDNLTAYVNTYNHTAVSLHMNEETAMSDQTFSVLLKEAQGQWVPGGKLTAATNAFTNSGNYFTTAQAKQLITLVDEEANRLQLAKLSYRSIVDKANFSKLFDVFNSQQSKSDLTTFVNSYNAINTTSGNINGMGVKVSAMTDAQFNVLVENIKRQWIPGSRMTVVANAFANTDNHFTTYQARQLIQYITDEGNRLTLAKSSYKTIIDRNNFSQLYDLLATKASKDELAAYVKSQT